MYRIREAGIVAHHFSLSDVCGEWVSSYGSPAIRIVRSGRRYRLTYSYDRDAAFTVPVTQLGGFTYFNLYGRFHLAYDPEGDLLWLSGEGVYTRAADEA